MVVNLGTNDENYLSSLAGEAQKRAKADYLSAYADFVRRIDNAYVGVKIVAVWGMMCGENAQANDGEWLEMLARLRAEGIRITPLRLSGTEQNPEDIRLGHPGPLTHRKAARQLAEYVSALTGWEIERRV